MIEVLAVLGILAVLIAGTAPSVLSMLNASRLAAAAETVTGKLNEAQGLALTFSTDVEVRFFTGSGVDGERDAIQIFHLADPEDLEREADSFVSAGPREVLPEGIAFNRTKELSSLWRQPGVVRGGSGEDRSAAMVRFQPDGSTSLDGTESWFVTLVETSRRNSDSLPPNFATIQIDPATGRLEVYRPN